jgi:hypothetical protein
MKKLLIALLILAPITASAVWWNPFTWNDKSITVAGTVTYPYQGGTGIGTATAGDVSKCLVVLDDSPFTYTLGTCGSGGGGSGGGTFSTTTSGVAGQLFNYPNNATDIVLVGSNASTTAEVMFDPNIQGYRIGNSVTASTTIMGNATTTGTHGMSALFLGGADYLTDINGNGLSLSSGVLTATLGTTIAPNELVGNPSAVNGLLALNSAGTGFVATSTHPLYVGAITSTSTSISSIFPLANITKLSNLTSDGFVKTSSGDGTLSVDTTTYESGLTAGDGLTRTANDFDCDTASGSAFGCLASADWTTFNNKVATTRALTVAGTANQITSSAGAQDLSADRTWTLSFPNQVIFPQYASSTLGFSTVYASSTSAFFGNLTSTIATFVTKLLIPFASNPTVDTTGQIAIEQTQATTSIKYYDGTAERMLSDIRQGGFIFSTSTASTYNGTGTTTLERKVIKPRTVLNVACTASTTGTAFLRVGDGVNWSNLVSCSSTGAITAVSSNGSFIMGEVMKWQIGTIASNDQYFSVDYTYREDLE